MGTLDDIKKMQREGKTEQEISAALQAKGIPQEEIISSISQSKIKEAVSQEATEPSKASAQAPKVPSPNNPPKKPAVVEAPEAHAQDEMQPSIMSTSSPQTASNATTSSQTPQDILPESLTQPAPQAPQEETPAPAAQKTQAPQASTQKEQIYPPAQPYPSTQQTYQPDIGATLSSDTITEIAEQVVSEKLSSVTGTLEKVLDLKTTLESKLDYMDERVKRIEGIIDRLQLSILQKVGEYVTNVNDMKTELAETQKSFKALLPKQQTPVEKKKT